MYFRTKKKIRHSKYCDVLLFTDVKHFEDNWQSKQCKKYCIERRTLCEMVNCQSLQTVYSCKISLTKPVLPGS